MPITDSTRGTLDPRPRFFDRPVAPGEVDRLAGAVADWLDSDELRWLVEHVPGRRTAGGPVEPLGWPEALRGADPSGVGAKVARLARTVAALDQICDWSQPGTAWDCRVAGERPLEGVATLERSAAAVALAERAARASDDRHATASRATAAATAVARHAAALGLTAPGRLERAPRSVVVLGGRRLAPLNRARVAAAVLRGRVPAPTRVVLLCGERRLEPAERASAEVRSYAPEALTEADLMTAAARRALDPAATEVRLVEVPAPAHARRASTYDTLRYLADDPEAAPDGPVALVTSPTCRPFQFLEAVRALGLPCEIPLEIVAHPPAWASGGADFAAPSVYLQEIRSTIQAAGRLARSLATAARSDVSLTI